MYVIEPLLTVVIVGFTAVTVVATAMSFLPLAHGIARCFDFPRLQILALVAVLVPASVLVLDRDLGLVVVLSALGLSAALQLWTMLPYSRLWRPQSIAASREDIEAGQRVKLLLSNVLQSNTDYAGLVDLVRLHDPDICIFMETDRTWRDALDVVAEPYQSRVEQLLDNLYGMMVWSKFEFVNAEARYTLKDDIPSVSADVRLGDGAVFRLIALHPEPPCPIEETVQRDAEIVLAGLEAAELDMPVIVAGDLNDVAWSRTTARFLDVSGLRDPRVGRGPQNTFHAHYWFARWPLDHVFHSDEFRLVRLKRLPAFGSDHFPIMCELVLLPSESRK